MGLHVEALHFRYPSGVAAIRDLSLHLPPGESLGLVGANGAGKSTLLWLLTGLLLPEKGRIVLQEATGHRLSTPLRHSVGLVFQDADDQLFMPTVLEEVTFAPLNRGYAPEEAMQIAEASLTRVAAWHLRDRAPFQLSGGEKRRVSLAAVLAGEPEILLLDEPGTGLDPRGRRALMTLVAGLPQTRLLASHDLEMILALCPRSIVMDEGKIVAEGVTKELLQDERLMERTGLETPRRLLACPRCGYRTSYHPGSG
ncbi:MAG: energy-coupling factor ABC transporter ATP-binding protein [Magnetococcales bacterium]|nr:energy-coupling factor ABC transporter ATP-binding protein [Magnetococcales bacterium]